MSRTYYFPSNFSKETVFSVCYISQALLAFIFIHGPQKCLKSQSYIFFPYWTQKYNHAQSEFESLSFSKQRWAHCKTRFIDMWEKLTNTVMVFPSTVTSCTSLLLLLCLLVPGVIYLARAAVNHLCTISQIVFQLLAISLGGYVKFQFGVKLFFMQVWLNS